MKYFIGLVLLLVAVGGYFCAHTDALAAFQNYIYGTPQVAPVPTVEPVVAQNPLPASPAPVAPGHPTVVSTVSALIPLIVSAPVASPTPTPVPVWVAPVNPVYPSEWTTTDGQKFSQVKVTLMEADAITIMHKDGIALVEMTLLPPDLQKTFNYIPYCAELAAEKRKAGDAADQTAMADEAARVESQRAALSVTGTPDPVVANAANEKANKIAQLRAQITALLSQADAADAAARAAWDAQRMDGYGNRTDYGSRHVSTFNGSSDQGDQLRAQALALQNQLNALF